MAKKIKRPLARRHSIIMPSTKLCMVGAHKIGDCMNCDRLYFWRWVMNLVPRRINLNFWFGGYIHKGCEICAFTKSRKAILKAMDEWSREYVKDYIVNSVDVQEMALQRRMGRIMFSVYMRLFADEIKTFEILDTELMFRFKLRKSGLWYIGRLDSYGKEGKIIILREYKTASRIDAAYFKRLKFDKQIHGYALGLKHTIGRTPAKCDYIVFRKPSIHQRQTESEEQFLVRLEEDLLVRDDWYYITHTHRYGKHALRETLNDIEWKAFDLKAKYDYLTTRQLLNPYNWARNGRACLTYGTCPYFLLCSHTKTYELYLQFYRMRDIRYVEEQEELCQDRAYQPGRFRRISKDVIDLGIQGDA